jgi:uncharacterized protein
VRVFGIGCAGFPCGLSTQEQNKRMSRPHHYLAGVPCWIETLQPDPTAAQHFYGELFGWTFDQASTVDGRRCDARLRGRNVAGISQAPDVLPTAVWITYIAVDVLPDALERAIDAGATVLVEPVTAGNDRRVAIIADPQGVAIGLSQTTGHGGAQAVNEPGAWTISALHSADAQGAAVFYGAVFGWELASREGWPVGLWRRPGYAGPHTTAALPPDLVAVLAATNPDEVPPHWAVNMQVQDVDDAVRHAQTLGATIVVSPVDAPTVRSAAIQDPQGAVIAISASPSS